jgi:hypothetical protein
LGTTFFERDIMAISTGELINVIERWEARRDEIKRWRIQQTDLEKKNFLAIQENTLEQCILDLEKVIAASMRCGISL